MMKILIDTDVCLDFILQRQPFFLKADELFLRCSNGDFEGYVSAITPINIYYVGRKEIGRNKVIQAIDDLLIMPPACEVNTKILNAALTSTISDYEDAVQNECAIAEKLDAIITQNIKDYKNSTINVFSPDDFLKYLQTI